MAAAPQPRNCPACDAQLEHRRNRPEVSAPAATKTWVDRLTEFYALPAMKGAEELAESGTLDRWECPQCEFRWDAINGSLDSAVGILMLGFIASGKSTYIASMGLHPPAGGILRTRVSGRTWNAFSDFYATGRALPQTKMANASNPIVERVAAPTDKAAGLPNPPPRPADVDTALLDQPTDPDLDPPAAGQVTKEPPAASRVIESPGAGLGMGESRYRVFALNLSLASGRREVKGTALLLDMPGEALAPDRDLTVLLDQARSLVKAPMIVFCLDPTQLEGLRAHLPDLGLTADRNSPAWQVSERLSQVAKIRSKVFSSGVPHGHLAVVLLKGDRLEGLDGFPRRALEEFSATSPSSTWARLRSDSDDVRRWLLDGIAPGIVHFSEDQFGSVSYHVVTATGCPSEPGPDDKMRYPHVSPRRVLDPVTYYYLMRFGTIDGR